MCGRISFSFNRAELLATYAWLRDAPDEDARYNIAPTDPVVAVGPHRADLVRWGIDGRKGGLFNIRSETAIVRPYYHRFLLGQRILVPATHFYEWRTVSGRRLPVAVSRVDGKLLNLAGLLGSWQGQLAATIDRKSTRLNSSHTVISSLSLHDALPIYIRSETAIVRPYYHRFLLGQRILVPATHFYEWRTVSGRRLPVAVSRVDGKLLNLAGLLGSWQGQLAAT